MRGARSAFGVRRSAFGVRRSAFGVRRSAFDDDLLKATLLLPTGPNDRGGSGG